jgi:acyl carrier protein
MGLEHVDFVLALEDRFSIRVPSARMEEVCTVGDAEKMVLSLVGETGRAFD